MRGRPGAVLAGSGPAPRSRGRRSPGAALAQGRRPAALEADQRAVLGALRPHSAIEGYEGPVLIGHKREIADALSGPALNTRRLSRVTQGLCDAAGCAVIVRKFDGSAIIFRPFTPAQRLKAAPARPPEGRRCLSAKGMAQA